MNRIEGNHCILSYTNWFPKHLKGHLHFKVKVYWLIDPLQRPVCMEKLSSISFFTIIA